jgi:hypothetical protein
MRAKRGRSRPAPERRSIRRRFAVRLCVIAFTLLVGSAVTEGATDAPIPSSNTGVDEPLREYRAFRRMHAWNDRMNQEAWLDAWTELKGGRFQYRIVIERGSETIRTRVLRAILSREEVLINEGNGSKAEITSENYEFTDSGWNADGLRYVQIKPRRKDVLLVDGRMVLTPDGGDLLRVEGRLAKNPSFWTSLVNIVRRYARIGGVRVPVATESTAKLKFAGTSQLEVSYEYESVNGRNLNLAAQRR